MCECVCVCVCVCTCECTYEVTVITTHTHPYHTDLTKLGIAQETFHDTMYSVHIYILTRSIILCNM